MQQVQAKPSKTSPNKFSMEYLNAFVGALRDLVPDWIVESAHKAALPKAGGKARWREREAASTGNLPQVAAAAVVSGDAGSELPVPANEEESAVEKGGSLTKKVGVLAFLPSDVAATLAIESGEPAEDLHITLAYFGDLSATFASTGNKLVSDLVELCIEHPPIPVRVSGLGRWEATENSDGRDVMIATVDSKALCEFRERLVNRLRWSAGLEAKSDFAFTPHITLSYLEPEAELPVRAIEQQEFFLNGVTLALNDQRISLPFLGRETIWKEEQSKKYWLWTYFQNNDDGCWFCKEIDGAREITEVGDRPDSFRAPNPLCLSGDRGRNVCQCKMSYREISAEEAYLLGGVGVVRKSAVTQRPPATPGEAQQRVSILKKVAAKQIVYGVVLEPEVEDLQKDVVSIEEIESAAHYFLANSPQIKKDHKAAAAAELVESFIAPVDFDLDGQPVKRGSWVIGVHVSDRGLWREVDAGVYTGFSLGGVGKRIPMEV